MNRVISVAAGLVLAAAASFVVGGCREPWKGPAGPPATVNVLPVELTGDAKWSEAFTIAGMCSMSGSGTLRINVDGSAELSVTFPGMVVQGNDGKCLIQKSSDGAPYGSTITGTLSPAANAGDDIVNFEHCPGSYIADGKAVLTGGFAAAVVNMHCTELGGGQSQYFISGNLHR